MEIKHDEDGTDGRSGEIRTKDESRKKQESVQRKSSDWYWKPEHRKYLELFVSSSFDNADEGKANNRDKWNKKITLINL